MHHITSSYGIYHRAELQLEENTEYEQELHDVLRATNGEEEYIGWLVMPWPIILVTDTGEGILGISQTKFWSKISQNIMPRRCTEGLFFTLHFTTRNLPPRRSSLRNSKEISSDFVRFCPKMFLQPTPEASHHWAKTLAQ